jgi:hypothetical protein
MNTDAVRAADASFRRFAGIVALLSAPLAVASLFAALPAVDYDFDTVTDLMLFLRTGAKGAAAGRWSMLLDMLGYYLLIAPAVICVGQSQVRRAPLWAGFFTRCVLTYVVVGAVGAAVLAAALPALMRAYPASDNRLMIETVYRSITDAIYGGVWNIFEELVAGVGWLGLGWLLHPRRPRLGKLTILLGLACLVDGVGNIFGLHALADPGLYVYLLLGPAWAVWLGIDLLRAEPEISAPAWPYPPGSPAGSSPA